MELADIVFSFTEWPQRQMVIDRILRFQKCYSDDATHSCPHVWGPVSMMMRFLGVVCGTSRSFYDNQLVYAAAVNRCFKEHIDTVLTGITQPACLIVDVRYDTPGKKRT